MLAGLVLYGFTILGVWAYFTTRMDVIPIGHLGPDPPTPLVGTFLLRVWPAWLGVLVGLLGVAYLLRLARNDFVRSRAQARVQPR